MRWLPIFARGFMIGVMLATLAIAGGCSSTSKPPPPPPPKKDVKLTEHQVQSVTMSMADDIMFSVADACAQVKQRTASPRAQLLCANIRLGVAIGTISAATAQNPQVGYVDLLTLLTLQRIALEEASAHATLEEPDRKFLHDVCSRLEQTAWSRVLDYITQQEADELMTLIVNWRKDHPDRASVSQVRLAEFAVVRQAAVEVKGGAMGAPFSGSNTSVLRLLRLDPMQGLDPATRQIRESRLLAERVAFWGQRIPLILGWQMELTAARLLESQPVAGVLANAAEVSKAAGSLSGATTRMAASYEHTLDIFPSERKAAIEQVDRAAAAQVKAAIDQSAAAIAVERKAAVEQVGKELSQRMTEVIDRLGKQVDAQSKRSIDQAAAVIADERTRVLVDAEAASQRVVDRIALRLLLAIVAGVIFGGCVALAYRWITTRSRGKGEVEAHVEQEDPAHASVRTA